MTFQQISDVTPLSVRAFRKSSRLSQREFWAAIDIGNTKGSRYETGIQPLPQHVRRLIFLHYGEGSTAGRALDLMKKELETVIGPQGDEAQRT